MVLLERQRGSRLESDLVANTKDGAMIQSFDDFQRINRQIHVQRAIVHKHVFEATEDPFDELEGQTALKSGYTVDEKWGGGSRSETGDGGLSSDDLQAMAKKATPEVLLKAVTSVIRITDDLGS